MSLLDDIERIRNEADCIADAHCVDQALARMAAEITAALGRSNPLVYVVMNGGLVLAGRLLPLLPFPLEVDYLHASRYGGATSGGKLDWQVAPHRDAGGRTVLVLDDILDEGHTLAAIVDHFVAAGATRVWSAVLSHKLHERKARPGMRANFTCLDVPDRFLFGCGMDYRGYWRNAPGIYAIKDSQDS